MRKKIVCFIVITMLCAYSYILCACSNDGFELVYGVEYTTNGSTKSEYSRWRVHYSAATYITKQEYDASPSNQRISSSGSGGRLPKSYKIPDEAEGKTLYIVYAKKTSSDNLKRYYWARNSIANITQYFEVEEMYTTYYYVYVKVIDSTTIVVRNDNGDTTYTVSSYSITKFN